MKIQRIPASQILQELLRQDPRQAWLDVRSEGEYQTGGLPYFLNAPILNDEERKAVGTCYKRQGQAAAIALGIELTEAFREQRAAAWIAAAGSASELTVCCWRGGLRSQYASEWLSSSEVQREVRVGEGGYKAIRSLLLNELQRIPALTVIAGSTGAQKTELLQAGPSWALDFEAMAHHRGSAFGGYDELPQPAQATFENRVLLRLHDLQLRGSQKVLVEDESIMVGSCTIPPLFKERMNAAPTVVVEASIEERTAHLVDEYAMMPQRKGRSPDRVLEKLRRDVLKLQKGLGGLLTSEILRSLEEAFSEDPLNPERHSVWVRRLLVDYYDRQYTKSLGKWQRPVVFRGNFKECKEWIQNQGSR